MFLKQFNSMMMIIRLKAPSPEGSSDTFTQYLPRKYGKYSLSKHHILGKECLWSKYKPCRIWYLHTNYPRHDGRMAA